jgi:hypothetical protein
MQHIRKLIAAVFVSIAGIASGPYIAFAQV